MSQLFPLFAALILLMNLSVVQAEPARKEGTVQALSYGVALFHLFQQQRLAAITEITAAKQRGRMARQGDDAELLLGSLYYEFGLPGESEKIFEEMLSGDKSPALKNRVWFNLARLQYDNNHFSRAQDLLLRIDDRLPAQYQDQRYYMLSNIFSHQQRFRQATLVSQNIQGDSIWAAYAGFNLGVQLLNRKSDSQWLQKLASGKSENAEIRALQDQARYVLGLSALRDNYPDEALDYFNQVHIDAPVSNKALLATGWALYKIYDFRQAIKYWQILRDKNVPDAASEEALLAMADAWDKIGDKPEAIRLYQQSSAESERLLSVLDGIAEKIRAPSFMDSLLDKQLFVQRSPDKQAQVDRARINESAFLYGVISGHDFQAAVQNYRQLLEMKKGLEHWQQNLPLFELMLKERKQAFHSKQLQLDVHANQQRLQALQSSRNRMLQQVKRIQAEQDFRSLANENEKDYLQQLDDVAKLIKKLQPSRDMAAARQKYHLLSGLLDYQLETEFPARFWTISHQLQLLDRALAQANDAAISLQQAAENNKRQLSDLAQRINGQRQKVSQQLQRTDQLLTKLRKQISGMAIAEIEKRKKHTLGLRLTARFTAARLLDELAQQSSALKELAQ